MSLVKYLWERQREVGRVCVLHRGNVRELGVSFPPAVFKDSRTTLIYCFKCPLVRNKKKQDLKYLIMINHPNQTLVKKLTTAHFYRHTFTRDEKKEGEKNKKTWGK